MEKTRKIQKIIKGRPVLEGAGVRLKRLFGFNKGSEFGSPLRSMKTAPSLKRLDQEIRP